MNPNEIDVAIASPQTYADEKGFHALFARIRVESPVRWTEPDGYRPFWTISKYADILDIERQPDLFINAPRTALRSSIQEEGIRKQTGNAQLVRTIIQMDGAEHRAYRLLTQSWFMPPGLRLLEDQLVRLAKQFVDRMAKRDGACDFVRDVGVWYPLHAIMIILGAPEEDAGFLLRMTQQHFGNDDPTLRREGAVDSGATVKELFDYFDKLTARRRKNPRNDLATLLANAIVNGKPISDFDRNSYYFIMALAGHDTTSSSISGMLLALLQHPEQLERLRNDPSLMDSAIDEGLRWVSPVKHFFRTATRNYVLRGQSIRAGDSLMLCYPSGNRDEEVFDAPFEFRIDRSPNRHLTFGYGVHACLGRHLAKLEIKTLFNELITRTHNIRLAGPPEWTHSNFVGGLKSLPISYQLQATAL